VTSPDSRIPVFDWAAIAAATREKMGDEWIERYGDASWQAMMVVSGYLSSADAEGLHFGDPPPT
jgi:hypothetical protein